MATHAPDWWRPDSPAGRQPSRANDPDPPSTDLPAAGQPPRTSWTGMVQTLGAVAVALVAVTGVGMLAARRHAADPSLTTGTLVVDSNPTGAQILIDGAARGVTPATVMLAAGTHAIELRGGGGGPRSFTVAVPAGVQISQYIELAPRRATTGRLSVRTNPPGARVTVDDVPRGSAPVTLDNLAPGEHTVVVLSRDGASITQSLTVDAGTTSSLVVPLAVRDGAPLFGWVAVSAPVELQLFENGRLLGSSQSEHVMVAAGSHQIEILNKALGYRATRTVQVTPGKVAAIPLKLPAGTIAVNAVPWADVWLDGEAVGETPIGNLPATIGSHEIVFRHPDLGEQRRAVTVTLTAPLRVSVDLRKK